MDIVSQDDASRSFSILMEHGPFVKKFDADRSDGGSYGLMLLKHANATSTDDYNKGSRFEIGHHQSEASYVGGDGDGKEEARPPFQRRGSGGDAHPADGGTRTAWK